MKSRVFMNISKGSAGAETVNFETIVGAHMVQV